jgi:hypothetical protein
MNRIATTPEQSKKLLGLGLNPETSDMFWLQEPGDPKVHYLMVRDSDDDLEPDWKIPAWSLSKLLEILPDYLIKDGCGYWFELDKTESSTIRYWSKPAGIYTVFLEENDQDYVACAFKVLCFLLENELI